MEIEIFCFGFVRFAPRKTLGVFEVFYVIMRDFGEFVYLTKY